MRKLTALVTFIILLFSVHLPASAQTSLEATLGNVSSYTKSPVDDRLLISDIDGSLFIWDAMTQITLVTLDVSTFSGNFRNSRWSPQGNYITVSSRNGGYIWDANTGELLHILDGHPVNIVTDDVSLYDTRGVTTMVISPDESLIVTMQYLDSVLLIWDLATGELLRSLDWHELEEAGYWLGFFNNNSIGFSPDGTILASIGFLDSIMLWDVASGERLGQIAWGELFEFSPDGQRIVVASGSLESIVSIYDVQSLILLQQYEALLQVQTMTWTADSQTILGNFNSGFLITGHQIYSQQAVHSWNITTDTHQIFNRIVEHEIPIVLAEDEVIFSFSINEDQEYVQILTPDDEERFAEWIELPPFSPNPPIYHPISPDDLFDYSLSPDNRFLITAHRAWDFWENLMSWLLIWDFQSGELLAELPFTEITLLSIDWLSDNQSAILQICHSISCYVGELSYINLGEYLD